MIEQDRVAEAEKLVRAEIERKLTLVPVVRPLKLFLRAFKQEKVLEVWAKKKDGTCALVYTYPILAASGDLGPKRREGDRQVPEGFYSLTTMNPKSRFLLSVKIDYPNALDRKRGPEPWGGDIYIHGKDVSIGCLALGDQAIREFYLMVKEAKDHGQKAPPIQVFPCRDLGKNLPALLQKYNPDKEVQALWKKLAAAEIKSPKL